MYKMIKVKQLKHSCYHNTLPKLLLQMAKDPAPLILEMLLFMDVKWECNSDHVITCRSKCCGNVMVVKVLVDSRYWTFC